MSFYYAQNREDLLIKGFFPDINNGFYIDIGANDPIHDSVTKLFYDNGWRGINIEPIRQHWRDLERLRPDDLNLQIGLSDRAGKLEFTEYPDGDGLSTFDKSMQKMYQAGKHNFPTTRTKHYIVEVQTLQTVIQEHKPSHIHFIKIDVEGYEYEVIRGYDWKLVRPELVCIEANHIHKDWRPLLEHHKYEFVFFDGLNNYYIAQESMRRKGYFNYPDAVLSGNPVYEPASKEIEAQTMAAADIKIQELFARIKDHENEIAFLHRQQRDVRFLAKRLAQEIQIRINKRAHTKGTQHSLTYKSDPSIARAVQKPKADGGQLISFIHDRDIHNITKSDGLLLSAVLKRISWRLIGLCFSIVGRFSKKIVGRLT